MKNNYKFIEIVLTLYIMFGLYTMYLDWKNGLIFFFVNAYLFTLVWYLNKTNGKSK